MYRYARFNPKSYPSKMESPDIPKENESGVSSRASPGEIESEKKQPPERTRRKKWWIIGALLALIVVVAVVLATTLSLLLNTSSSSGSGVSGSGSGPGPGPSDSEKPYWPGWSGIKHLVVFGDSMTSVSFSWKGDQPSRENPIGNPDFPGETSSIGANWVGDLTATWNESFIRTVDLAGGGATVDGAIFRSKFPGFRSFKTQVESDWIPNYSNSPDEFDWKANSTLFASFFGLNDVRDAYFRSKQSALSKDIAKYIEILGTLYSAGARNFLVLKLTPLERAPNSEWNDAKRKRELGSLIEGYNANLTQALSQFSNSNPDAGVFFFDTHAVFNQILDDPCSYPETCAIKDTTAFCPAYANERVDPYQDSPDCAYPLDKYFWINGLHPIFRVHNATAKAIAAYLNGQS